MRKRITIFTNEDYLRQISSEVDFEKEDVISYINELREFCENEKVFALAPVQIGIAKRIIYFKNTTPETSKNSNSDYNENEILINPKLISSKGHTRFLERCASCEDYVGTVDRPYIVEVEFYTVSGEKKHEFFEGFKATVFCHEYDHLNGILHIDLADDVQKMTYEQTLEYRKEHPYKIISYDTLKSKEGEEK